MMPPTAATPMEFDGEGHRSPRPSSSTAMLVPWRELGTDTSINTVRAGCASSIVESVADGTTEHLRRCCHQGVVTEDGQNPPGPRYGEGPHSVCDGQ